MAQETARMVFTDPPYNVKIDGHVGGAGKIKHREFAMAFGEMSQDQFTRFLTDVLGNMADASCDGSIHFVCMDWRHMSSETMLVAQLPPPPDGTSRITMDFRARMASLTANVCARHDAYRLAAG